MRFRINQKHEFGKKYVYNMYVIYVNYVNTNNLNVPINN